MASRHEGALSPALDPRRLPGDWPLASSNLRLLDGALDYSRPEHRDFVIEAVGQERYRLAANLGVAQRFDLSIYHKRGVEQLRLPDISFPYGVNSVGGQESITFAKAMPSNERIARLATVDGGGGERLLRERTFNPSRSVPGATP